jgi:sterol desaturase/sphingolipid hydroxylase (fatty acid hydroxylase superfamily)
MDAFFEALSQHYNWVASLAALAGAIVLTKLGKYLLFKVPALAQAREYNRREDNRKWAKPKYPPMVKGSQKVGLYSNLAFFALILPFCVTLDSQPWWRIPRDVFIVLVFYDFFYYLMHRFWFHGNGYMRKVHAIHHQARQPTHLDAHYVHPLETFLGLALFFTSIALLAALLGAFHGVTISVTFVLYTQLNTLNHAHVGLNYFPFRIPTWIASEHHKHHENMHKGNFASMVLIYDKLFGTFE